MASRHPDWVSRFNGYVEACRQTPFDWERTGLNCITFAAGSVEAVTGRLVEIPDWDGERGALRLLDERGGLEAIVTDALGEPHDNWRHARRGDIALINQGNRPALMVCGGLVLFGPSEMGLETRPLKAAVKVWRVG